jgi:mannose-1-phosphate guanylyltransferase
MVAFHKSHGGEGTIMVTEVTDPSKYGVVVADANHMIQRFVEKPKEFISNKINAGFYLFKTSILNRIENRPTSIEKEIFPVMAAEKQIYQMVLPGFWMDIGQPKDYLIGQTLALAFYNESRPQTLASGANIKGNVLIHPSAKIDPTAVLGPNVVIGEGCSVGPHSRLINSTLMSGSSVGTASYLDSSIVGWKSHVYNWCRVMNVTVIAEDVKVADFSFLNGTKVLPNKGVEGSHPTEGTIIM